MAGELQKKIDRVNTKTQLLLDRYTILLQRRESDLAQIAELQAEIETLRKENGRLQQENDFLKIATTIAPTRNDVNSTRELLTRLVREIDKCITDLNE
jgi:hypothetical protein